MVAGRPPRSFCTGPMPQDCGSKDAPNESGYFPSFVNNLVTPFVSCWQPPINSCVTPSRPTRSRQPMPLQLPDQPQQKINIHEPHPNDVLCGRGGSSNRHVGNLNFRCLVAANKEMYVTLTKKQKMMVARKVVETIHMQDPPGRFLQKDSHTGLWFDIGVPRSLEKTSQALREKTPSTTSEASKPNKSAPVSPGGSSVTAASVVTEDIFSDVVTASPTTPKSSPLTPTASPVAAIKSDSGSSNQMPSISIPEHLESQFHPPRRMEVRSPHVLPRWNHEYPPIAPPTRKHPYPPSGPPSQPYPGPPYTHNPPPPPEYYRHHSQHRVPYSPQYPPSGFDRPEHRQHGGAPPPPYGRPPFPKYVSSSANRVPPSPDQKLFQGAPSTSKASEKRLSSLDPQGEKVIIGKGNAVPGRQTAELSPGRAQAWKRRRTVHGEPASLTDDLGNRLTLKDSGELKSPSGVLQSRSRRGTASGTKKGDRSDTMSGLAALSSAALLKLDEGGD